MMNRREALKTMGLSGAAVATLNGEALCGLDLPPDKPSVTFSRRLGWYGEIHGNKEFEINREPTVTEECPKPQPGFILRVPEDPPHDTFATVVYLLPDTHIEWLRSSTFGDGGTVWSNGFKTKYTFHPMPRVFNVYMFHHLKCAMVVQSWNKEILKVNKPNSNSIEIVRKYSKVWAFIHGTNLWVSQVPKRQSLTPRTSVEVAKGITYYANPRQVPPLTHQTRSPSYNDWCHKVDLTIDLVDFEDLEAVNKHFRSFFPTNILLANGNIPKYSSMTHHA